MSECVTVTVAQGALRGQQGVSKCGQTFYSFRGVPYAKPPVGPLRFKAPQPSDAWEGIRDALQEGAVSPHTQTYISEGFTGDEDCLFLNVYTPKLPSSADDEKRLAVMVFIHGGGFNTGSGTAEFYGPDFILNENVVLVTINYRLGALGFLSTGDSVIPGNNGLKDQLLALRWVQQNIAQFAGDPGNVTIFGESAGAASVHCHMLSPSSKGLFARAIAQSGSVLNPWAFNPQSLSRQKAFRFGEALGCKTNDSNELLEFLNTLSPEELVEGITKTMTEEEMDLGTVFFRPTLEPPSGEAYMPDDPFDLLSQGKFHNVPYLTGVNSNEGLLCLKEIMSKPSLLKKYDDNFEIVIPNIFGLEKKTKKLKEIAEKIKKFYFGDKSVSHETLQQYVDFSSDAWFALGVSQTARLHASKSSAPVYCYLFSFDGELGFLKRIVGADRFPGVCHADELGYLFFSPHLDLELDGKPEEKMRSQLVKMWTNFAKTGDPSPKGLKWEPVTEAKPYYLNINLESSLHQNLFKERMSFWNELKKLY